MTTKTDFEIAIEEETGESVESIRQMPIDERRRRNEGRFKQALAVMSFFPFIGRASVLRDRTIHHEEMEMELDKALRL